MSRAFVKESDGEWLGDVAPDVSALERFLTRENGERVYEVRTTKDVATRIVDDACHDLHEMSNGNRYALDEDGRWRSVE